MRDEKPYIYVWLFFGLFGILSVVLLAWPRISVQTEGATAFLGAVVGVFGGLLAILAGAFYNADLNRKRDDRIRRQERNALAAAFLAEMETAKNAVGGVVNHLDRMEAAKAANKVVDNAVSDLSFTILSAAKSTVLKSQAHRIGLLGNPDLARLIVSIYSAIEVTQALIPDLLRHESDLGRQTIRKTLGGQQESIAMAIEGLSKFNNID